MTQKAKPKLFFTVAELATMAEVSPYRMRNLLRTNQVPVGRTGQRARKGVVYVAEIAAALPGLADSIRFRKE